MSKRKVTRDSNIPGPQQLLKMMAEDMYKLAEELSELGGRELRPQEQELIRLAHLPVLNEIFADMKAQYMATGYIDKYELERLVGSV